MKNILDGKYVVANKRTSRLIINELYKNGYKWYIEQSDIEIEKLFNDFFEHHKKVYIYEYESYLCSWYNNKIDRKEISYKVLLRESKLKRILKSQ